MRTLEFYNEVKITKDGRWRVTDPEALMGLVVAAMAWPEDKKMRLRSAASDGARRIEPKLKDLNVVSAFAASTKNRSAELKVSAEAAIRYLDQVKLGLIDTHIQRYAGGFGNLFEAAMAPSLDERLKSGLRRAAIAGRRLWVTHTLAMRYNNRLNGGASLSKATELLVKQSQSIRHVQSKYVVAEAWKSHRAVAHIAAALDLITMFEDFKRPGFGRQNAWTKAYDVPGALLAYANAYLEFGCAFRALRSPQPLLDPRSVWRIPQAQSLPRVELWAPPLPECAINHLNSSYRAPRRL